MFKTAISTFCVLVAASLAVELNKSFTFLGLDRYLALFLSVVLSAIVHKILEFLLLHLPYRFRVIRQYIDPISTIEGYWYEEVDAPNNPFTYACIDYDFDTNEYTYYGNNFYKDFNLNATFRSTNVRIERSSNSLHFHFYAQVFKQKQPNVSGYGLITFYKDGTRNFTRGEGHFIDNNGLEIRERRLILCKLNFSTVKEILGKKYVQSDSDIKKLVKSVATNRLREGNFK